jgi:hypothetical protein
MPPRLNIPLRLGFWPYLVLRRHSTPQQLARTWVIDSTGQRLGAVSSIHRFRDRQKKDFLPSIQDTRANWPS